MKIGLVTYEELGRYPSSVPDENKMLFDLFTNKGHESFMLIWDDEKVNWSEYDVLIIKSTWDYFVGKIDLFYAWLEKIKTLGIPCYNNVDVIRWNADKHYLSDIQEKGLNIVPTLIFEKGESFDLNKAYDKFNTDELVIKPCISGGAMNTIRVRKENAEKEIEQLNEWLKQEAYLVQPLMKEILEEGEWSFIYFNEKFSHSLLKVGKENEFRIQHFFGGSVETPAPSQQMLTESEKYIKHFAKDTLYARVDGVWSEGKFMLMELELIEPYLFFFKEEQSLENYYKAFEELIYKK